MAYMMVPAGIDAARDLQLQFADRPLPLDGSEACADGLSNADRACVREVAVIEAGAGDDIRNQAVICGCKACRVQLLPEGRKVALPHVGQHQVLLVRDADLIETEGLGQLGHKIHLVGACITRDPADRLQGHGHDRIAGNLVPRDIRVVPGGKVQVTPRIPKVFVRQGLEGGGAEIGSDTVDLGRGNRHPTACLDLCEFGFDLSAHFLCADLVDEDLDARLVDIVASSVLVIDAHHRLEIGKQVLGRNAIANKVPDDGCAPLSTPHPDVEDIAPVVAATDGDPDVMHLQRRAILRRGGDRDLELAGQVGKLRVECRPLTDDLGPDARVFDLVGGSTREVV